MGRKRRRRREEEKGPRIKKKEKDSPSKLQTSWNKWSRQKERGQSKAGAGSAPKRPMKEDVYRRQDRRRRKC